VTQERFDHFQDGRSRDKENHPHLISFANVGTGKSRLAQDALELLKVNLPDGDLKNAILSNSVQINISFNSNTKFLPGEKDDATSALGWRVLASYFGFKFNSTLPKLQSFDTVIDCVLSDHRQRNSIPEEDLVVLYLAIDDAGQTLLAEENLERRRSFLKAITNIVGGSLLMLDKGNLFAIPLLTGTTTEAIQNVLSHPHRNLAVPLLTMEDCLQILANEDHLSSWVSENKVEIEQALADIDGIPRLVNELIVQISKWQQAGSQSDWDSFFRDIQTTISTRYVLSTNEKICRSLINLALTRQVVYPHARIYPGAPMTFYDIESQGGIFLDGNQVKIPYLLLKQTLHHSTHKPLISQLFGLPSPQFWQCQTWEKFNALYDGAVASCHADQQELDGFSHPEIKVSEFYAGAIVNDSIADIVFQLSPDVEYYQCSQRFPETSTELKDTLSGKTLSWQNGSVSVLNAAGASVDHFMASPIASTDHVLVRLGQEKWTGSHDGIVSVEHIGVEREKVRLFL
jgi:hypothetical protein